VPTQDQVVWANVNLMAGGEAQSFPRGALLPDAASAEEIANRSLLRIGGAIRTVEVVYTADELAAQARAMAEVTAAQNTAGVTVAPPAPAPVLVAPPVEEKETTTPPVHVGARDTAKPAAPKAPAAKPPTPAKEAPAGSPHSHAGPAGTHSGKS
jgi:hypothetical protein